MQAKFKLGEEVLLNNYHENYYGCFKPGEKVSIEKVYVAYRIVDEYGNPLGGLTEDELKKITE